MLTSNEQKLYLSFSTCLILNCGLLLNDAEMKYNITSLRNWKMWEPQLSVGNAGVQWRRSWWVGFLSRKVLLYKPAYKLGEDWSSQNLFWGWSTRLVSLGKWLAASSELGGYENSFASQIPFFARGYHLGEVLGIEVGWGSEGISPQVWDFRRSSIGDSRNSVRGKLHKWAEPNDKGGG